MTTGDDATRPGLWSNGLLAPSYVPLTDVSAPIAPSVLTALERARIAAYLAETAGANGALRLYVASGERSDARTIVASVVRANGAEATTPIDGPIDEPGDPTAASSPVRPDPLAGIDADAEFAALIANWHVDTHQAIREAERDLSREDEDWRLRLNPPAAAPAADAAAGAGGAGGQADDLTWLDEDHYVPPNPPPIPRPSPAVALGLLLIAVSIILLGFGTELGLPGQLSLFLAVCGVLTATGLFVMRLREHRDEDDDGAVV